MRTLGPSSAPHITKLGSRDRGQAFFSSGAWAKLLPKWKRRPDFSVGWCTWTQSGVLSVMQEGTFGE